ncbi:pyridoxal phosphate-dependent transferase [Suillus spraguei]|nr:pyridoxal phosphate-dependent transferase [Suillus spraguei]
MISPAIAKTGAAQRCSIANNTQGGPPLSQICSMDEPKIIGHGANDGDMDLSHHLSSEARNRVANPLKDVLRVISECPVTDPISMANGDPHHSLYPFRQIMYEISSVQNIPDPVASWRNNSGPTQIIRSYKDQECALSIRGAFPFDVLSPKSSCNVNYDGITKVFRLFGEKGDHFLTDEFSFPSITNCPLAYGIKWVGVKMDAGGIIPEELERVLIKWDEVKLGRRPRVLYMIPVGQNPTGSMLSMDQDDPYYFLQYDIPQTNCTPANPDELIKDFRSTLIPTFLSMDVDGRVLRIDTFSKVLAPGMRFGWITSNKLFHLKLADYINSSTQPPHAFGQIFITEMLSEHG